MMRAQAGDADALNDLFSRHVPLLSRWARGRLPVWARDLADTHDLVQETVLQTFKNMQAFESRGKGALRAYLRQALLNRVRNEIRRVSRRPAIEELDERAQSHEVVAASIGDSAAAARAVRSRAVPAQGLRARADRGAAGTGSDLRRDGRGAGKTVLERRTHGGRQGAHPSGKRAENDAGTESRWLDRISSS